jgi:putative oxidoreductase
MKKLLSTRYSDLTVNLGMLILRMGLGILMIVHGYDKLVNFNSYKNKFMEFMGMSDPLSLALTIFAEFFCALFLILGLFTRFSLIPLIIVMLVALGKSHQWDVFGEGEHASLYLVGFFTLMLLGPGKISVDGMIGK